MSDLAGNTEDRFYRVADDMIPVSFQIDKKLMKAANMVSRVRKEVEIHSRLKHPSILEVGNH